MIMKTTYLCSLIQDNIYIYFQYLTTHFEFIFIFLLFIEFISMVFIIFTLCASKMATAQLLLGLGQEAGQFFGNVSRGIGK